MEDDIGQLASFLKRMEFLGLTNDLFFKAYFVKNKKLLKSLLTHFLPLPEGSPIVGIEILNPELISGERLNLHTDVGKTFVLDIRARYERKGSQRVQTETVNVEIQTTNQSHFTDRILAYSGRLYSEQLKRGEGYGRLNPVYSLVFTTKNLREFKNVDDDYRHVCNIRRTKEPQVVMSRGMCFVIVELGKFTKVMEGVESGRDGWCYMLKNSGRLGVKECETFLDKGGEMADAIKHLWDISQDEKLREAALARDKQRRDIFTQKDDARREGLEEGREEGREEERRKVAVSMLNDGFSSDVIEKHTGLAKQEVEALISKK